MWLVLSDSGMSKEKQELERGERENEQRDQDGFDRCRDNQQEHLSEDELDEEFWIEVTNLRAVEKQIFVNVFFYYFWFPVKIVAEN